MLRRVVLFLGIVLLSLSTYEGITTYDFIQNAILTSGTVVETSINHGPPRAPTSESLRVKFSLENGSPHEVDVAAPFLRQFERGTEIPILVKRDDPSRVKLPFLAELWKWPLTHAFFGVVLAFIGLWGITSQRARPAS